MKSKIFVGFCVAYDWEYLKISLPLVYQYADKIYLAIDKNRISWSGKKYHFDFSSFKEMIKEIDLEQKIIIYEDSFYIEGLTPMENENRERRMINECFDRGGWSIQLDVDEYFLDFHGFIRTIKSFDVRNKINFWCPHINLVKKVDNGYIYTSYKNFKSFTGTPIATNSNEYLHGRVNSHRNIKLPFYVVNQTQARSENELRDKLTHYGHSQEINIEYTIKKWKELNGYNYQESSFKKIIHDMSGNHSSELAFINGAEIRELIENLKTTKLPHISISMILLMEKIFDILSYYKKKYLG